MPNFISSALVTHKFVTIGAVITALIVVGSGFYAYVATRPPKVAVPSIMTTAGAITASGVVEPLQNPDLSFAASGRVTQVSVAVGDTVSPGRVLASLDTAALVAARAGAAARLAAAESKLAALQAGPRGTDVAVKQAAVDQANQIVRALYAALPATIEDAYGKSTDAVVATDADFSNPNATSPALVFSVSDNARAQALSTARVTAAAELKTWQVELTTLPVSPTDMDVDQALTHAVAHATVIRSFEDALVAALTVAIPTQSFSASQITAALSAASVSRAAVAGLVVSLTGQGQTLVADKLAVATAQSALAQLNAGASTEDIAAATATADAARAIVSSYDAQIRDRLVIAPFAGTVASVAIKPGEIVVANAPAVTLVPASGLEVTVYVTEVDVGKIAVGDTATITLDAYGAGRPFGGTVASVDQAPSQSPGGAAYKVELTFTAPTTDIKSGMTANATITPHN